ncbi:MAG: hypothetical protein ALECFALPRED_004499 [Alectoria fallacina]|uniref:Uncharacterized protein n=1 Tax=Alectoria fallacina TaxID=1903189 RepID=A0A8H3FSJ4_9LECA|nr:MAG: hypothetical protein ALECFALPRED_004499 [Alectoria fallacina]
MASILTPTLSPSTLLRLQNRRSYMAKAPFQQHKPLKRALSDVAMKFCPVIWLGPYIIRAHDKAEYEKDRKYVQEVYIEYQEHRSRKNSVLGAASGGGSVVDLQTYLAPVECVNWERRDLWRQERVVAVEEDDPWRLPPPNEIV